VEAAGGSLKATIVGTNIHETKLLAAILEERHQPTEGIPQHLRLDKGYDNSTR
jgi:hypothetical protein